MSYTEMTNEKLDEVANKEFNMGAESDYDGHNVNWWLGDDLWQPTDKDSNQIERYLFLKIESKGWRIVERRICVDMLPHYEIIIYNCQTELKRNIIARGSCEYYCQEDTKINRIKLFTVLQAWCSSKS